MPRGAPPIPKKSTASRERPITDLSNTDLYVVLHIQGYPPTNNQHHWGLFHYHAASRSGEKYHITGRKGRWLPDHMVTAGVFKSRALIGLVRVAMIPGEHKEKIKQLIKEDDKTLDEIEGIDCRVWVLRVLGRLRDVGLLKCGDATIAAIEEEITVWANLNKDGTYSDDQLPPLKDSHFCELPAFTGKFYDLII